jgi:hypothetical protein
MAPKNDIYEVTVEGEYYAFKDGRKTIFPYTFKFKADDAARKTGLLSVFRNAMRPKDGKDTNLLRIFKSQNAHFKAVRTHVITNTVNLSNKKPVQELALWNRAQITAYIDRAGLPIECDLYPVLTDLRQALRDYNENPEAFEKQQEKRRNTKGTEIRVMNALDRLNPAPTDLPPGDDKEPTAVLPTPEYADTDVDADADFGPDLDPLAGASDDPLRLPEFDDKRELDDLVNGI